MKHFKDVLEEILQDQHISQKDLAQRSDLTNGYISLLINGKRDKPSYKTVEALVRALNVDQSTASLLFETAGHTYNPNNRTSLHGSSPHISRPGDSDAPHFIVGPPVINPHLFFGREHEIKKIFKLLNTMPMQHIAIIGPRRSGKTSLLYQLKNLGQADNNTMLRSDQRSNRLKYPERYRWVMVDFQKPRLRKAEGVLRHILEDLHGEDIPPETPIDELEEQLEEYVGKQRTIILLDEIEAVIREKGKDTEDIGTDFWDMLRSIANASYGHLSIVLAAIEYPQTLALEQGITSPFFNIFGHAFKLGPLQEEEVHALIDHSQVPFTPDDIAWIVQQSKGWPSLVQFYCNKYLWEYEEAEKMTDEWKQVDDWELEPYRNLLEESESYET